MNLKSFILVVSFICLFFPKTSSANSVCDELKIQIKTKDTHLEVWQTRESNRAHCVKLKVELGVPDAKLECDKEIAVHSERVRRSLREIAAFKKANQSLLKECPEAKDHFKKIETRRDVLDATAN